MKNWKTCVAIALALGAAAALPAADQIEVACTIEYSSKIPDHSIERSSHIGDLLRSRPWKRG